MQKSSQENYCIDFYRFIFSLIIMIYHSWMFTGIYGNGLFNYGFYAVDFYFIVTGYVMMNSINKRNDKVDNLGKETFNFIYRKIKKIFPAIIVSFLIGIIFVYGKNINIKLLVSDNIIGESLLLGILGYEMPVNIALWYISAMIMSLMILYPFARKDKEKYIYYIAPLILFITLMLVRKNGIWINAPLHSHFFFRNGFYKAIIFIILGNLSFKLSNVIKDKKYSRNKIIALSIVEPLIYILLIYNMHFNIIGSIFEALLFTFVVALSFSNITFSKRIFKSIIWKKLGIFGFYVFLSHIPVRTYLLRHNIHPYNEMLIKYILISLAVTTVVYIFVEIILKNYKKNN